MFDFLKKQKPQKRRRTFILDKNRSFPFQESYRTLRTNLNFTTQASGAKSILITSSTQGEGKSTVAINTAISLAQEGKKVLLIDADLRKPSLHRYLRVRPGSIPGLSSVLIGKSNFEDAIGYYKILGIDLMIAGQIPPNPTELLALDKFSELIKYAENEYDYVIVDAPPVGIITDAAIISHQTDAVLFIVAHNYATQEEIVSAKKKLEAVNAHILGVVLNNYDINHDLQTSVQEENYYYSYKED